MNSRQRFQILMDGEVPDRILRDYWAVKEVDARLLKRFGFNNREELLAHLDIDFRYIDGPVYTGPPLKTHGDGSEEDLWGVPRKIMITGEGEFRGTYKAVTRHPLAECTTVQEINAYPSWPDPDWFDYSVIASQCDAVRESGRVVMFMGDRLNRIAQLKPAMYLRGITRILADMRGKRNRDLFVAITDKIKIFYNTYLERILEAARGKIDVIVTGDDFGTQHGLFCQENVWREMLMPGFKHYIDICKKHDVFVMHHTCGSIRPIIGDMVECGLDILNPIQPGVYDMDHSLIKEKFGATNGLVFHGGVSLQGPLRFGTPAEVEAEVKERINTLGKNGGYIICTAHNIQADTKMENILALFSAYDEYSEYLEDNFAK